MEMTTAKTVAVFAIIFGCFAVLYPKIFHPMVLHVLGLNQHKPKVDDIQNRLPHHMRPGSAPGKGHASRDDVSNHLRGGPHPGLRAAAEMKKQAAAQQGSSGKGMMGVVLPMYAVGIVIYLIYTMTKVFGRKEKGENSAGGDYLGNHFSDIRYNADKQKFVAGDNDEELQRKSTINQQKDLEKLLLKADREDISDVEMLELKRRLLETEAQMARILEAMEAVQQKVGSTVASASEALAKDNINMSDRTCPDNLVENSDHAKVAENSDDEDVEESIEDVGAMDYATSSEDEEEVSENRKNRKLLGEKDLRNYVNLAEEFKDLMNDSSSCDYHDVNDNKNGDLRQRIIEKQQSE